MIEDSSICLLDTFNAKIWAEEWLKTIKEHPEMPTDEDAMISWFANALMAGHDYAARRCDEKLAEQREACFTARIEE